MKLKFKNQSFQAEASNAVVNVFKGQPKLIPSYMLSNDFDEYSHQTKLTNSLDFSGWCNQPIVPELSDQIILNNLHRVQLKNGIRPSDSLEGKFNLTIEMETGIGKTYTYIKTMYELNKHYGWSKFIVVVPSVAIREGIYKSFQVTTDHFAEEYNQKIRFFIYSSSNLTEIYNFASTNAIHVMIINSQAFNATGKDARRIYMELDRFRSRRPIDIIAQTNPIIVIDEPQSVEGTKTKERLKDFNPLMTLRYSATHKSNSIYNMVYRLDAMDAYNQKLVKKIVVKGINESGSRSTNGYVYLEHINLSQADPLARIEFDIKGRYGIKKASRKVGVGYNLYEKSGELEEYQNNFIIKRIDGRNNSIEFVNGTIMHVGDIIGQVSEEQIRRIQIRETIVSHIERERILFNKEIKVLSLFFIDEVANYKKYDKYGVSFNGNYANIFEEEYLNIVEGIKDELKGTEDNYLEYLNLITAKETHSGYFSIDKKGKMTNSILKRGETSSSDVDAYDLIMKNKELLLDRNPSKSPVRFIFSHSALKEGWDNPNVFQICTLKHSGSDMRKRQEVGRGLRICVNQDGERMDTNKLGYDEIHNVNVLTIIASESYESFATSLQQEIAETITDRPTKVDPNLFDGKLISNHSGYQLTVDSDFAHSIYTRLLMNQYIDNKGNLTLKYYNDKTTGTLELNDQLKYYANSIITILDSVYNPEIIKPENASSTNVTIKVDKNNLAMTEFKNLWNLINKKSIYIVDFDTDELIHQAIETLNNHLNVSSVYFKVEIGEMKSINSNFKHASSFNKISSEIHLDHNQINQHIKFDLIGKLVDITGLTRTTIIKILKGIQPEIFNQFKSNPEEFIIKCGNLINEQKATSMIEHITYNVTSQTYSTDIFTDVSLKGRLNVNTIRTTKHLYDHLLYDSNIEKEFATNLDVDKNVAVYVKLPSSFFISTPVGKYNPDWAISFIDGDVKHIYFVAETKGSLSSLELREIEKSKIHCATQHFKTISDNKVIYKAVDNYSTLLDIIKK
ncbi:MAG: restriction endonuclease subunit R [Candidatus Epulonipiscioides saccharophilum]|nr:MAG: restriction endonuclease subunit R [Epulopiscium sp. AS2M-Bin001]